VKDPCEDILKKTNVEDRNDGRMKGGLYEMEDGKRKSGEIEMAISAQVASAYGKIYLG